MNFVFIFHAKLAVIQRVTWRVEHFEHVFEKIACMYCFKRK
jgi:hypothetical protein